VESLLATVHSVGLSGAAALVALATGVAGGTSRYAAVLYGRSEQEVERATAIGFFAGLGFTVMVLLSEYAT
jgi:hypothetical protein